MDSDVIFFIGPQGSGKGTQAKRLAARLGFFYWENGAILREAGKQSTELGQAIASLLRKGVLLSDDLLLSVVKHKLDELGEYPGVVFDGIPRRISQAEFLLPLLAEQGRSKFLTLFIDLSQEISVQRLLSRAQAEGRSDDTREAIEFRLSQYQEQTVPVLDYLRRQTTFLTIDGQPSIDEVTLAINSALA